MSQTVVKRGGRIALPRAVVEKLGLREGDVLILDTFDDMAVLRKRSPFHWRKSGGFLPDDFEAQYRR